MSNYSPNLSRNDLLEKGFEMNKQLITYDMRKVFSPALSIGSRPSDEELIRFYIMMHKHLVNLGNNNENNHPR